MLTPKEREEQELSKAQLEDDRVTKVVHMNNKGTAKVITRTFQPCAKYVVTGNWSPYKEPKPDIPRNENPGDCRMRSAVMSAWRRSEGLSHDDFRDRDICTLDLKPE